MYKHFFFSIIGYLFPLVVAIPVIPYLIGGLGQENFGVLGIVWTIVFFARACDFGISAATTYYISKYPKNGKIKKTAFVLILKLGFVFQALSIFLYILLFLFYKNLPTPFLIALCSILPMAFVNFSRAMFEAQAKFKRLAILRSIYMSSNFFVPAIVVYFYDEASIFIVCLFFILSKFAEAVHYFILAFDRSWIGSNISNSYMKTIMHFGKWIGVNSVIGPIFNYTDRFVSAIFLTVSSLSVLLPATEIINRLMFIPLAISSVLFPKFSRSKNTLFKNYLFSIEAYYFFNTTLAAGIIILSNPLMKWWLDELGQEVSVLLAIYIVSWPTASYNRLLSSYLQTRGCQKEVTLSASFSVVVYLFLLVVFVKAFGLIGAPIASVLRVYTIYILYHRIFINLKELIVLKYFVIGNVVLLLILLCFYTLEFSDMLLVSILLLLLYLIMSYKSVSYLYRTFRKW